MTTHHITLLTEHAFFQTLWRHPLEGNLNRTVAVLPEVRLVAYVFSQTKVRYFDTAITINPGLEIGTSVCLYCIYLRSIYSEYILTCSSWQQGPCEQTSALQGMPFLLQSQNTSSEVLLACFQSAIITSHKYKFTLAIPTT